MLSYNSIKKEVNEWIPSKIVDAHVHTGTSAENVDVSKKEKYPLSYGLLNNRKLSFNSSIFSRALPKVKIYIVGFPLPLPFKSNPNFWNNELMIPEMKKGINGLMHFTDISSMEQSLIIAKKKGVSFKGIKFHPRMFPEKKKKEVLLSDMINKEVLEFAEKNKLAMITELSHGYCSEDILLLKEIDSNYKINVIIPHMGYNYLGFVMHKEEYDKTFVVKNPKFEKEIGNV